MGGLEEYETWGKEDFASLSYMYFSWFEVRSDLHNNERGAGVRFWIIGWLNTWLLQCRLAVYHQLGLLNDLLFCVIMI